MQVAKSELAELFAKIEGVREGTTDGADDHRDDGRHQEIGQHQEELDIVYDGSKEAADARDCVRAIAKLDQNEAIPGVRALAAGCDPAHGALQELQEHRSDCFAVEECC